jgi:hypothetical protein
MYLISSGICQVLQKDRISEQKENKIISKLKAGDYFGVISSKHHYLGNRIDI